MLSILSMEPISAQNTAEVEDKSDRKRAVNSKVLMAVLENFHFDTSREVDIAAEPAEDEGDIGEQPVDHKQGTNIGAFITERLIPVLLKNMVIEASSDHGGEESKAQSMDRFYL